MVNSGTETVTSIEENVLYSPVDVDLSGKKKGRKRSYHNKVVVHDIFLKCAEVVKEDSYWRDVFNDAAYAKFLSQPYYVKEGVLIYSKGTTVNQLKIASDPEKTAKECIAFFQTTGGYHSRKDIINDNAKRCEFEKSVVDLNKKREWNNFSRSMRKFMISKYTDRLEKEYDLNKCEKDYLHDLLVTGMSIGYMCKATVSMHPTDNVIDSVKCIEWNENKRKFNFTDIPKSKQISKISPQNPLPYINDVALTRDAVNFSDGFSKRMSKYFDYNNKKKKEDPTQEKAMIIEAIMNMTNDIEIIE